MQQHTAKQDAIEAIQRLPEDADIDEIMYCLSVIDTLHKSREAVQLGQVISQDDVDETLLRSEPALEEWLNDDEEAAWAHLQQRDQNKQLRQNFNRASEESFSKVWDNDDDALYDKL